MLRQLVFVTLVAGALSAALPRGLVPMLDGRIVGGQKASIEEHPHQISLLYYGSHRCGGSIIDASHVVTAGHCTDGASASALEIRAGSSNHASGGVKSQVASIHQHPQYDSANIDYDITVLKLETELELEGSDSVKPVALPDQDAEIKAGAEATITGWGATREGGSIVNQLQAVKVPVVSNEECADKYNGYVISDRMLCAGIPKGGKDACQGDSGGPLLVDKKLTGVVSWGYGCARPNYPGVYASVPNLRSFIKEVSGL